MTLTANLLQFYLPMFTLRKDATGAHALWNWMQKRWTDIESKMHASLGIFGIIVGIMIRGLVSKDKLEDIQAFFATKDTVRMARTFLRSPTSMHCL
jgi:hypothetical protein